MQTIQFLTAVIIFLNLLCGFTDTLRNVQHATHRKGRKVEEKKGANRQKNNSETENIWWVVQHHGYEEGFLNPREGKLLFEQ